jgi:phospholipid transport system substrate-binding protein
MSSRIAAALAAGVLISALAVFANAPQAVAQQALSQQAQGRGAAASAPEAGSFITNLATEAIQGVTDKSISDEERVRRFRELLKIKFDVPQIARFVLGRYWRTATPDERDTYTQLFEDYIVQTYADRFHQYNGEGLKVVNATRGQDDDVVVISNIERNGPAVRVEWKLHPEGSTFKIVDVMVEGVSMAVTQRDDFAATIQARGGKVAGLIDALRQKTRTASN